MIGITELPKLTLFLKNIFREVSRIYWISVLMLKYPQKGLKIADRSAKAHKIFSEFDMQLTIAVWKDEKNMMNPNKMVNSLNRKVFHVFSLC